jgi:hypothetical protein
MSKHESLTLNCVGYCWDSKPLRLKQLCSPALPPSMLVLHPHSAFQWNQTFQWIHLWICWPTNMPPIRTYMCPPITPGANYPGAISATPQGALIANRTGIPVLRLSRHDTWKDWAQRVQHCATYSRGKLGLFPWAKMPTEDNKNINCKVLYTSTVKTIKHIKFYGNHNKCIGFINCFWNSTKKQLWARNLWKLSSARQKTSSVPKLYVPNLGGHPANFGPRKA